MNKKGFTLMELLAVIILISLLAVITGTVFTKSVKESNEELYQKQLLSIKLAAEAWGSENLLKLPDNGECKHITLEQLKDYGVLDSSIKDPRNNKEISDNLKVKIVSKITDKGIKNVSYEVNPKDITGCESVYPPICTLIIDTDSSNSVTPGDQYKCLVKYNMPEGYEDGYVFYVLNEGEETIDLIMDQNINSNGTPAGMIGTRKSENKIYNLVEWISDSAYGCGSDGDKCATTDKGPITAMQFLYNATKSWTNVEPVNYTYEDRAFQGTTQADTSYTSFISNKGVATITSSTIPVLTTNIGSYLEPLRARMPIYSSDQTKTEVKDKTYAAYLYDNIDPTATAAPYGYWTLSSYNSRSSSVPYVSCYGTISTSDVYSDKGAGVRPVITVKKTQLR